MAPYSKVPNGASGGADDHEALLADDDLSLIVDDKHSVVSRWKAAVSLVVAALLGAALGLMTGYGLFASTDTSCVSRTTQSSMTVTSIFM